MINKCGPESTGANAFINAEINMKKLRLHTPKADGKSKCHNIHVTKRKTSCQVLKVHGFQIENVDFDTYLGDIISKDGRNSKNIEARVSKGLRIVSQIHDILKQVNVGAHYFKTAITLN